MKRFSEIYFNKPLNEVGWDDVLSFLSLEIEESQNLEYKPRGLLVNQDDSIIKPKKLQDVVGFVELAKQVSGFANAEGGLLILGIKEKVENFNGQIIKKKPGELKPLPPNITREMIELRLYSLIQHQIENLLIKGITNPTDANQTIYLFDIPQSLLAPHRVNEIYYFQRYNFDTLQMKHYQIADLFGRRRGPFLEVSFHETPAINKQIPGHFALKLRIHNKGNAVAKYTTCILSIKNQPYNLGPVGRDWQKDNDQKSCQASFGLNTVVFPDIPTETGYINFIPEKADVVEPLRLEIALYAEGMEGRTYNFTYTSSQM